MPPLSTPDGRRAWAFAAICGGCAVFTLFAAVGVYLVRGSLLYTLMLAMAAHLQILVGMTALGWALGRRMTVEASRTGARISDQETIQSGDSVTVVKDAAP